MRRDLSEEKQTYKMCINVAGFHDDFFMGVNVNVMAADTETPDNAEKALQYAFSPGESSSADSAAAEDIDLAENDPQINMAGSQKALRTMQARTNDSKERYTVLVLDTSASSDFWIHQAEYSTLPTLRLNM